MRERETIYSVYKYITPTNSEDSEPSYYLVRTFDNLGPVDFESLYSVYTDLYPHAQKAKSGYIGPFPNLTTLNKFAFSLTEKLDANRICLLSISDFNSLLDCVGTLGELGEHMAEVGSVIENIEKGERKKSIFSKILGP